jgi:hypothetical protein
LELAQSASSCDFARISEQSGGKGIPVRVVSKVTGIQLQLSLGISADPCGFFLFAARTGAAIRDA